MRIPILTFGAIASVLTINSSFATSSTVTSRDYVDTQDALKQNKIPAAGTNASTPGETVVTYTTTGNGVIGERGIYDGAQAYTGIPDKNKLVTVDVIRRNNTCIQSAMPGFDCEEEDLNGNCLLVHLYEPTYDCDDPFDDRTRCLTNADCTCPSGSPSCDNGYCGCVK